MLSKQDQITKELHEITHRPENIKLPEHSGVETNLICGCGKNIRTTEPYFIRIEPGEKPEIFCEFCITIDV